MESPSQNQSSEIDFTKYRPAYRSLIFSLPPFDGSRVVFCNQGPTIKIEQALLSGEHFFEWTQNGLADIADALGRPWAHVNGDYFLYNDWQPTSQQIFALQKYGLNIFNYEPLFILNPDGSWPWMQSQGLPRYPELEKISEIAEKFQIPQITLFLCENNLGSEIKKLFPRLHFESWNSYFFHVVDEEKKIYKAPPPLELSKKFLNLNFRYEAVREMLSGYLFGAGYDSDSFISFYHHHEKSELLKRLPFDPSELPQWSQIEQGIQKMQLRLPLSIDVKDPQAMNAVSGGIPDMNGQNNQRHFFQIRDFFAPQAFAYVYCESRPFSPRAEISEKTISPLFYKKPFIPFAAPHFLESIRQLGFQTFGDNWDESYDAIENHRERYTEFLKVIDFIAQKSWPEILDLQKKLQPVLEHNLEWARNHVFKNEKARLLNG